MIKKTIIIVLAIILFIFSLGIFYSSYVRRIRLSPTTPEIDQSREATALSAFFGLDALPIQSLLLYYKAFGKNGMPIVFSQEIDPSTLDQEDFAVTTQNGSIYDVEFVTLKPANEEFELRTVLLIGHYGDYPANPPISVEIVGDLLSRSGQNYKGQTLSVIPLPDGPTISYAEYFMIDEDYPYVRRGSGCDCPREQTKMVVRAVWSGGVRATNGNELGDDELMNFLVTMVNDTDTTVVNPYKLADLNDNDNNIDLCLDVDGIPIFVKVNEGIAIDPRGDNNPQSHIKIISRW